MLITFTTNVPVGMRCSLSDYGTPPKNQTCSHTKVIESSTRGFSFVGHDQDRLTGLDWTGLCFYLPSGSTKSLHNNLHRPEFSHKHTTNTHGTPALSQQLLCTTPQHATIRNNNKKPPLPTMRHASVRATRTANTTHVESKTPVS